MVWCENFQVITSLHENIEVYIFPAPFCFFNFKDILDAAIRMFGYFFLMSRRLLV